MKRLGRLLAIALLAASRMAGAAPAPSERSSKSLLTEVEAGGTHFRVETRAGPVHVFRPAGYDRRTAGIVVYVHGYYVHIDDAWREHNLARQFASCRRNALFIAPEAPSTAEEKPPWARLRRSLIATTLRRAGLREPGGPLIVVGHSGAYRSIVPWLDEPTLHNLILVDALYGNEDDFRAWLDRGPNNRMTLIVKGTAKWADPFVRALPYAVTVPRIPSRLAQLPHAARTARVLALRSQYGHFELITDGKVLPVVLGRTALATLTSPGAALLPATPLRRATPTDEKER